MIEPIHLCELRKWQLILVSVCEDEERKSVLRKLSISL
jgi:hypothetical protein